jgi:hypothetical protein
MPIPEGVGAQDFSTEFPQDGEEAGVEINQVLAAEPSL